MVRTFTNALSVSHAGKADVRAMLIGSFGCNLAWGIIDGIMYVMNCLAERSHKLDAFRALRVANDPEAERILVAELPDALADKVRSGEVTPIIRRLRELPEPPSRPRLSFDEWLGALGVFALVFYQLVPSGLSDFAATCPT